MLTVLLVWTYAIITTYLLGYGFLMSFVNWPGMEHKKGHGKVHSKDRKKTKNPKRYECKYRESYIITGVVVATVYAQVLSLFTRVALGANIFLVFVCVVIAVFYKYELLSDLYSSFIQLRSRGNVFVYLAVFLIMAYGASHGIMHYDSDLYHAQAIHWIEDYGIIRGLGNLHVRLAYNSAAFPLSALYSFSFLGEKSLHAMSGFFALLLAWQCVDIKNFIRRGRPVISDFARLAAIYYLFTIYDEMVAPASDYFLSCLVFYVIIHWLDMYVRHEKSYVPYILLALLGIFAITIKLSAAPMVLLSVVPVYRLMKDRTVEKFRAFWLSVVLAFVIVLPFLLRNVILSGWLLYPVTFIDLFKLAWKIPKGIAAYDALEIRTFGRGYNDVAAYGNLSFGEWVPAWFQGISGINKLMLILDMISVVAFVIYMVYFFIVLAGERSEKIRNIGKAKIFEIGRRSRLRVADYLTIGGTLICCLLFWFLSAPLIRYGVVYVFLTPAVILGRLIITLFDRFGDEIKGYAVKAVTVCFLAWLLYKGANLVIEDAARFNADYLVRQQDYGEYEVNSYEMGGITFYYPASGDQVGYDPFPASTHDVSGEVELMGSIIADGFKAVQN
jgi:hypothetical protein